MAAMLVAGAAVLAFSPPAGADRPTTSAKKAEAQRVLGELQQLDVRLEQSVEAYNLARIKLAATAQALKANAHHLRIARRNLSRAQRRVAERVVYLYTAYGPSTPLEVFLGASSLSDLLDRFDATRRVAEQDALVLDQVKEFRARFARQRARLRHQQRERARLSAELASQRSAIEAQMVERRQLLSSIKDEIAQLQARERERQERLRREAEARIAAERARLAAAAAARQGQAPPEPGLGVAAVTPEGVGVAPESRHGHVVAIAMRYLGIPYRWGGASPSEGFDCSGLVLYVYAQVGISLPHNAAMQYGYGVPVAKEDLQPGDIVFFNNLGHNGIYIGGGQFIQAPKTGDVVKISSLSEPWYAAGYVGARRIL